MGDGLWCGQAQNGVNFDFDLKFDLEGLGWLPQKTKGTLTKVFCIFGPNLVILASTGDELSRGQTWWRTDGQTGATTIPGGQNWPRVKMSFHLQLINQGKADPNGHSGNEIRPSYIHWNPSNTKTGKLLIGIKSISTNLCDLRFLLYQGGWQKYIPQSVSHVFYDSILRILIIRINKRYQFQCGP